ncbi:MAG: hypothetical protein WCZ12_02015 [Patescibacteria group bacterium]
MKQVKRTKVVIIILIFLGSVAFYFLSRVSIPRESMFLLLVVALACFLMLIFVLLLFYFKTKQERILNNEEEFSFRIDYDYPSRKLVKRGKYVLCSRVITWKNFPKDKTGKNTLKAFLYKVEEPTPVLLALEKALDANPGFRAANLFEVMYFGFCYPEIIKKRIIISLSKSYSFEGGKGMRVWPFICREKKRNEVDAYPLGIISSKEIVLLVKD